VQLPGPTAPPGLVLEWSTRRRQPSLLSRRRGGGRGA
jgi:hypothetical protein